MSYWGDFRVESALPLTAKKIDSFLNGLTDLVNTLPTTATKERLDRELTVLIDFLRDVQQRLKSMPTSDNAEDIAATVETLKNYVRVAEADPLMSRALGFAEARRSPPRTVLSEKARREAKALAKAVSDMTPDDIYRTLADRKKYNTAVLREIAGEIGLHLPHRATRLSIIEKIGKKTANARGYRLLRGEGIGLKSDQRAPLD